MFLLVIVCLQLYPITFSLNTFERRVKFTNRCSQDIWINPISVTGQHVLDPGIVRLRTGNQFSYHIPDGGWTGRFWPKMGCDENGEKCELGQLNPPCSTAPCDTSAVTKVEFYFPRLDTQQDIFYDFSLVDGYSISAEIIPNRISGFCAHSNCGISLQDCPNDTHVGDLRVIKNGVTIQCLSPCKKWNTPKPFGLGRKEIEDVGIWYCCPTPPVSPEECHQGIVVSTEYVKLVREDCPTAYSYSYDDQAVLNHCPSNMSFEVRFFRLSLGHKRLDVWRPTVKSTDKWEPQTQSFNTNFIIVLVTAVTFIAIVSISVLIYLRNRLLNRVLSDEEIKEFLDGGVGNTNVQNNECLIDAGKFAEMKFNQKYALSKEDIVTDMSSVLGCGNFGIVYKGRMNERPVAIKQLKGKCTAEAFKSFLLEVKVHSYLGVHPNVVNLLGAYIREIRSGKLYVVTELCENGSLDSFLKNTEMVTSSDGNGNGLSISDLNRFCYEIASGMEHISNKKVIHGDLSARNVLLDSHYTCKISDFGLSRKLYEYDKYVKKSQEPIPWKWMAFETLEKMEFSCKSDAWSFGVTAWEIYSLGRIPYAGLNWTVDFTNKLKSGLRLPLPEHASETIYRILLACWEIDPKRRPAFSDLVQFFSNTENYNQEYSDLRK